MNRCCLCDCEFEGFGNNPSPLVSEGRCCDSCNMYVIQARMYGMTYDISGPVDVGDLVTIFHSKNSSTPYEAFKQSKFIAGEVTDRLDNGKLEGTWGNFVLDPNEDCYINLTKVKN